MSSPDNINIENNYKKYQLKALLSQGFFNHNNSNLYHLTSVHARVNKLVYTALSGIKETI